MIFPEWGSLGGVHDDYWRGVLHHMLLGCAGVGVLGFSTLVILLPMRGLGFIGYHPNLLRGATGAGMRGDPSATVVLSIVVVAGLVRIQTERRTRPCMLCLRWGWHG